MSDKEKNRDNYMEDRFTPEGIPIIEPPWERIESALSEYPRNMSSDKKKTKKGDKVKKIKSLTGQTFNKLNSPGSNEITQSIFVIVILILFGGLSWL